MAVSLSAVPGRAVPAEAAFGENGVAFTLNAPGQIRTAAFVPSLAVTCNVTSKAARVSVKSRNASAVAADGVGYSFVPGQAVFGVAVPGEPLIGKTPPFVVSGVASQVRTGGAFTESVSPSVTTTAAQAVLGSQAPIAQLVAFPPAAQIRVRSSLVAASATASAVAPTACVSASSSEITASVGAFAAGGFASVTARARASASSTATTTAGNRASVRVRSSGLTVTATSNPSAVAPSASVRVSALAAAPSASASLSVPTARVVVRSRASASNSQTVTSGFAAVRVSTSAPSVTAGTNLTATPVAGRVHVRGGLPTVTATVIAFTLHPGRTATRQIGGLVRPYQGDAMSSASFGSLASSVFGSAVPGEAIPGETFEVV